MSKHNLIGRNDIHIEGDNLLCISGKLLRFDSYKLLKIINNGANGIIIEAEGVAVHEKVAIKVWINGAKNDMAEQAHKEIEKMSSIREIADNRSLIHYYASGIIEGYYYCVMEYLNPKRYVTLREHCNFLSSTEEANLIPLDKRYHFIIEILSALRAAQEHYIFHGDLHLDNILFDKETSAVKIIDFGTSFRNREYSQKRDNKMMLNLAKYLLGNDFQFERFVSLRWEKLINLPQNAVRLLVKAMSKIAVLLKFLESGFVDSVVDDIALFAVIVPLFNMPALEEAVKSRIDKDSGRDYCGCAFSEKFLNLCGSFTHQDFVQLGISIRDYATGKKETSSLKDEEKRKIYSIARRRFLEQCERSPLERYIYRNYHEAQIFNSPLYGGSSAGYNTSMIKRELLAIEAVIE